MLLGCHNFGFRWAVTLGCVNRVSTADCLQIVNQMKTKVNLVASALSRLSHSLLYVPTPRSTYVQLRLLTGSEQRQLFHPASTKLGSSLAQKLSQPHPMQSRGGYKNKNDF